MFESRATAAEFLDRPDCDPALAAASYRFMETVNCRFGGIRIARRFLAAETMGRHAGLPRSSRGTSPPEMKLAMGDPIWVLPLCQW